MKKTCLRCGKDFKRLGIHLKSKHQCEAIYLNIPREYMIEKYDDYYEEFVSTKLEKDNIKKYKCNNCEKCYKHNTNLYRHKKTCQNINNQQNITNNINNGTIINNSTNNVHFHITLNNFGEESELSDNIIKQIFSGNTNDIVPQYVKIKHIDTQENRNILMKNLKDPTVKIYQDDAWKNVPRNPTMKQVMNVSISSLINSIKKFGNNYMNSYDGEDITKTTDWKKIEAIKEYLYDIEDNAMNNKRNKKEELAIACHLLDGKEKVQETMEKTNTLI